MNLTHAIVGVEFDGGTRLAVFKAMLLAPFKGHPCNVGGATLTTIRGATPTITEQRQLVLVFFPATLRRQRNADDHQPESRLAHLEHFLRSAIGDAEAAPVLALEPSLGDTAGGN